MRILSIDPGYERVGTAVIEKNSGKKEKLIYSDCLRTKKNTDFNERLCAIGNRSKEILETYKPDVLAIERLYFNTNQKTALSVAETRGVIVYLAKQQGLTVYEYTPSQVKIAVSGYGKSTKAQIAKMVPKLIGVDRENLLDDEYDAIAIGLTCIASESFE